MSWNYSVQLSDPTNAGGSNDLTLVYDLQQAIGVWSQYILGTGTLVVALDIASNPVGREGGGPTSSSFIGANSQGFNVFEPSSLYELTTGQHVSGTASDITITIDPRYFAHLDLVSNLTYSSPVPNNEYNPIVVFLHELMHGFGMAGWYSGAGNLPGNYESPFDALIEKTSSGAFFTGANAEAVFGGPVPLTTNSSTENYYHFGNQQSDFSKTPSTVQDPLTLDLMNGIVFFYDYQYAISNLDLAVLKDIGYNIRTPPVIAAQNVTAANNQGFAASSLFVGSVSTGDTITEYALWDSDGNGRWLVNGVAQGTNVEIDITAAQLAQTSYQAGSGTDHLWAKAYDGVIWGLWQQFTVTVPMPTLAAVRNDLAATGGQVVSLSSLVTIADPGAVSYQKLELWDASGTVTGGQFVVNGVAQTGNHEIDVTPANAAGTVFDAGTSGGTDTLWARLLQNDSTLTDWQRFTVTVPTPTLSVSNYTTATPGQVINLSSLATISDPGAVSYQKLELWDSIGTAAGGQFVVNGVAQSGGHEIDVTPANVAGTTFHEGTSGNTDTLWARLQQNDGSLTAWQQFSVVDPVTVAQGATVELAAAYAGAVNFAGTAGTLQLDNSAGFTGTVAGMSGQDTLDLRDINFASVRQPIFSGTTSGGTLSLTDGALNATIALLGNYMASTFVASSDGYGGTSVVDQPADQIHTLASSHA